MADNLLQKASILLTPTAYNNGSMLSIKPENGDGDFTFSRGGNASRVNSSGNIVTESANIPRIDYTDGCGSWLLEPQSTNLITYSEDFSQWNNTDITIGANGTSPSGEANANLIQTGTANTDQVNESFTISPTNTATYSIFIKRVSGAEWVDFLVVKAGFGNSLKVWFNINNGTVGSNNQEGTTTLDRASVEDFGNGWYRLKVTTTDTTNNTAFNIRVRTASADGSDTRVDNSSYYLWGAQLEAQSYATSYIPTNGATNTRLQDIATNSGNSTLINSTEGVLYAEIAALADDETERQISIDDGNGSNRIVLRYNSTSNNVNAYLYNSGVQGGEFNYTLSDITSFAKVAFKWKTNDFALWVNGVEVGSDSSGASFLANTLNDISFDFNGLFPFYGKNKALAVFKEALTDAQLQSLTSN